MQNKKLLKLKYPLLISLFLSSTVASATVVIQNDFTKAGISDVGTFGSGDVTPPGILYDPTGKGNFDSKTDYLTPGNPWQMFAVKTKETGLQINNNSKSEDPPQIETVEATKLVPGQAAATWTGKYQNYYTVTNRYSIDKTQKGISVQTVIQATNDLHEVKFLTAIDPDPDRGDKNTYDTVNKRGSEKFSPNDWVGSSGKVTERPLGIFSTSAYQHGTGISPAKWSDDPDYYLNGQSPVQELGDHSIGMGFLIGYLAAGQSAILDYQYLMGDSVADVTPAAMTNIDTQKNHYEGTKLGTTVKPIFEGGTLQLNQDHADPKLFYSSNFEVMKQGGTIDANGRNSPFSGVFSDYSDENGVQTGGALTITDLSGGGYQGKSYLKMSMRTRA